MNRLKYALVALLAVFTIAAPATVVAEGALPKAVKETCTPESGLVCEGSLEDMIKKVISVITYIIGAVAVIMVIFGGFRYITSGGDANAVASAKNTILYALIGLVIVIFSHVIISFVVRNASGS